VTQSPYQLSPEEIEYFHANGFVGPFQLCPPDEWAAVRSRIEQEAIGTESAVYGFETGRDRYLDSRAVYDMITHPAITERLAQLLGPDLLVWRSAFFYKPPGAPETAWHRANVFKEYVEHAILEPPDINGLFQLTTWIAIDEANLDNGCVQFISGGTHKQSYQQNTSAPQPAQAAETKESEETYTKQGSEFRVSKGAFGYNKKGFFGYDLKVDFDLDESRIVNMECKPGEFFIFDQRTLHGSLPNTTDQRRVGMNFRTIQTHVPAYRHFLEEGKIEHYGLTFDLTRWGCIQLRGQDTHGVNKIVAPPEGEPLFPSSPAAVLS